MFFLAAVSHENNFLFLYGLSSEPQYHAVDGIFSSSSPAGSISKYCDLTLFGGGARDQSDQRIRLSMVIQYLRVRIGPRPDLVVPSHYHETTVS